MIGAHFRLRVEAVADADLLCALHESLDETVVQRSLEDESRTGGADLPGVGEDAEERVINRRFEVWRPRRRRWAISARARAKSSSGSPLRRA